MNSISLSEVEEYVSENIGYFHNKRLNVIKQLTLKKLIDKNPYLLRAKNVTKASELIDNSLNAFLSSSEEKLFGDFLEDLAIFVAGKTINGHKSTCEGMDLEFQKDGIYNVVSIKSGTNWGNASQHSKLIIDFSNAEKRLRQSNHISMVQKVLGICYGKTKTSILHGYMKIVGQNFWTYISNNRNLYIDIIEPMGYRAKEHNDAFTKEKDQITNILVAQFITEYCTQSGSINWGKLLEFNSGNYDLDKFN